MVKKNSHKPSIKQRLEKGDIIYALIHGLASSAAAEMAAIAGYDVIVIDAEHGANDRNLHLALVQAVAAGGAASVIRLASHDAVAIGQALDLGVDGVMLPGVRNADEARAIVKACQYPPHGTRGYGLGVARASGYGIYPKRYLESIEEGVFITAMIECASGVTNARAIAEVEGIDSVIVGLQDLAADLGVPGDVNHQLVQLALKQIEHAVIGAGKAMGTVVHPGASALQLVERGHTFITLGADTRLLGQAMRAQLEASVAVPAKTPLSVPANV